MGLFQSSIVCKFITGPTFWNANNSHFLEKNMSISQFEITKKKKLKIYMK